MRALARARCSALCRYWESNYQGASPIAPPALFGVAAGRVQPRRSTTRATPPDHGSYLQQPERHRDAILIRRYLVLGEISINASDDDWWPQIAVYSVIARGLIIRPAVSVPARLMRFCRYGYRRILARRRRLEVAALESIRGNDIAEAPEEPSGARSPAPNMRLFGLVVSFLHA
jgi:hypothetical protein